MNQPELPHMFFRRVCYRVNRFFKGFMNTLSNALIIDKNRGSREVIQGALRFDNHICQLRFSFGFEEALEILKDPAGPKEDIVFISSRFSQMDICKFLPPARESPCGREAIYIQTLPNSPLETLVMSSSIIIGIDGFLVEPYSISSLQEAIAVAKDNKELMMKKCSRKLLRSILKELVGSIDRLAHGRARGRLSSLFYNTLRDACSTLRTLSGEDLSTYHEILTEIFTTSQLPIPTFNERKNSDLSLPTEASPDKIGQSRKADKLLRSSGDSYLATLSHPNARVRANAIHHLSILKPKTSDIIHHLSRCLTDPDEVCRSKAAIALLQIGTPDAIASVQESHGGYPY